MAKERGGPEDHADDKGTGEAVAVKPRRSFNEAAHKLPHARSEQEHEGAADEAEAKVDNAVPGSDQTDVIAHATRAVLALGALGVVYGDIGTSPLYTEQVTFGFKATQHVSVAGVYGIVSLIFWSLAGRRLDQVRGLHHARPQPRRRRHHGARGALPAPQGRTRGGARHARASSAPRCSSATA